MINIKSFTFSDFQINTYILYNEKNDCIIIDPGCYYEREKQQLKLFIENNKLQPILIFNTHCHVDHILGNTFVKNLYHIPIAAHHDDEPLIVRAKEQAIMFGFNLDSVPKIDNYLDEGQYIELGDEKLKLLHVPGHSPGSLVIYNEVNNFIIAGDVLFKGSIGRTDLPGGNHELLIKNLHEKLLVLNEDSKVYCGHGPETTIGAEKRTNPFLI